MDGMRLLVSNLPDRVWGAAWCRLRESLDRLQADLAQTVLPRPTRRMVHYLILAEDRRFGSHIGFDVRALLRAVWSTWWHKAPQGGSTVSMQLVRTLTRRSDRTVGRKVLEIYLAVLVSQYVSPARLPMLYLWSAYYGWRMHGFAQACQRLGVLPGTMGAVDEAEFVARLKYPERRHMNSAQQQKILQRGRHIRRLAETPGWTRWPDAEHATI